MQKLLMIFIISAFFLAGCQFNGTEQNSPKNNNHSSSANAKNQPKETREIKNDNPKAKKEKVLKPEAVITVTSVTYQSTTATISIANQKGSISKVNYQIWRTADGSEAMKTFTSTNPANHFSILLNTGNYDQQRGEYQIEAFGVGSNGKEIRLAKSAVTFPQYVPILMYHAIDHYKGEGLPILFVSPANFESQMQYLKDHGYTLLTFERFDDINKVNKPVFVTFDDGLKNNMNALQILEKLRDNKFKPTATEFVISGRIDSGSYSLSSADIKEMVNSKIFSIQSHTITHSDLRTVKNYEQELGESKTKLEQVTGKQVIALAYPIGYYNDKVVEETRKYYKYAVTTHSGIFIAKGLPNELYLMHRVFIKNTTTIADFARLLESH